tara:strand:+ start:403 stop:609 length:207 start_codon:yes stop_codon:yes gene_type:complete
MYAIFKFKRDTTYAGVEDGVPEVHFGRQGHVTRGKIVDEQYAEWAALILIKNSRGVFSLPAKDVEQVK